MTSIPKKTQLQLYRMMLRIRMAEEKIIELYPEQEMRTPAHLCIGQEAIAAGVCASLKQHDIVISNHRGHGHYIAKGGPIPALMAELYGKITGCSKGKGGSMHLVSSRHGLLGSSAIVANGIPLAVGTALGSVLQKKKHVSVVFFGDGAVDQGLFYESLNFAALKKLPVFFVCENNFYATNSPQSHRQALDNIHKKSAMYGIPGIRVDGNDVEKVFQVAEHMIAKARGKKGPSLLECRTYRWKGHVGPSCDYKTGCRPRGELETWLKRCPIKKYERILRKTGVLSEKIDADIKKAIAKELNTAITFAKNSPFPTKKDLLTDVY